MFSDSFTERTEWHVYYVRTELRMFSGSFTERTEHSEHDSWLVSPDSGRWVAQARASPSANRVLKSPSGN